MVHEKFLTMNNIHNKGIIFAYSCPFCLQLEESTKYIFLDCDYYREVRLQSTMELG